MRIDLLTVLPRIIEGVFEAGVIGRAIAGGRIRWRVWNLRDFAEGSYRQTDDAPYGGGAGMVMKPEPIARAVAAISAEEGGGAKPWRVLLSPQGKRLDQRGVEALAARPWLLLICGRYEGVDERVCEKYVDEEISIGDYVLTGGELPAMVLADAVCRLVPGVLGSADSAAEDSFTTGLLDHPHYTRPPEFEGMGVPEVLLSGNHEEIRKWRRRKALERTLVRRQDLLERAELTEEEKRHLRSMR
ncbi:MAG: tRNA (guanosine(37)-N1)-methyltransferase TrmD [bacterium]|nr:tRNA (guanosine(37)-N1)-methyltransferase TrmD [bacterium]